MHEYLCFINASSYFISFYDKRKKNKTELPETRYNPSLVLFIFIYTYYIYTCVLFDIAPIIAHSLSLASCFPCFLISSHSESVRPRCLCRVTHFFFSLIRSFFFLFFLYLISTFHFFSPRIILSLLSCCSRNRCNRCPVKRSSAQIGRHADRDFLLSANQLYFTFVLSFPRSLPPLNAVSPLTVACPRLDFRHGNCIAAISRRRDSSDFFLTTESTRPTPSTRSSLRPRRC